MKRRVLQHFLALFIICLVSFAALSHLFLPELKLIATPEFEASDATQLSYASKFWYGQKIKAHELPMWSKDIGSGFPVLGEGQTGIFYLPNIVLFTLLPIPLAYNISLLLVMIFIAYGMYGWMTVIRCKFFPALFGSMTLSLSGLVVFHLQHLTLLQTFSLMPMLFMMTYIVVQYPKKIWIGLFACILSQQICAGFPQVVFITLIGTTGYAWYLQKMTKKPWRPFFRYSVAVLFGIGLSCLQLIPSFEFSRAIVEVDNPSVFSFSFQYLLTYINPFFFGNPQNGSFFKPTIPSGSIFWENNGYIGCIPLLFIFVGLIKKAWRKHIIPYIIACGITLLLALGKFSPLYLMFQCFPFNLFRVPSRFISLMTLTLLIASIIISNILYKQKSVCIRFCVIGLWLINIILFFPLWKTYHPLLPVSTIEKKPTIVQALSEHTRIFQYRSHISERELFQNHGWIDMKPYEIFHEAIGPNINLLWNISLDDVYPSRILRRKNYLYTLLAENIAATSTIATLSATGNTLLSMHASDTILSGIPLNTEGYLSALPSITDGTTTIYAYTNTHALPRAFLVHELKRVTTIEEAATVLKNSTFDPQTTALVEKTIALPFCTEHLPTPRITTNTDKNTVIEITENPCDSFLVFSDSYYPGWHATIDGVSTTIYPANLRYRGIIVPKGTHTVMFFYAPESLLWGIHITVVSAILLVIILFLPVSFI